MGFISFLTALTKQDWLAIVLFAIAVRLVVDYFSMIRYPANLPRVCEKEGATSFRWSTRMKYYVDAANLQREAYEKFTKHGRTVLMPGLGLRDEVLLPHSSLRWLVAQPEKDVSMYENLRELDQFDASFPHERYLINGWQGLLIKKDMTSALDTVMIGLNDEIGVAFDRRFGTDMNAWREIKLFDTISYLVAQASARFTVSVPLCRNEKYLTVTQAWVNGFILNAGLCGVFPWKVLRWLARYVAYIPQYFRLRKLRSFIKPLYEERIKYLSGPKSADEPDDHFQLMLRYAQTHEPNELNVFDISNRVAIAALGAYHQTQIAATNIILNIISSDAEYNTISAIRTEIQQVLAKNGGEWTRLSIAQMWKIDSICRETMRLQAFGGRAVLRIVLAKDGILTEDGVRIPCGSMVSIPSWAGHTDDEIFDEPFKFDPFRYSRAREADAAKSVAMDDQKEGKATSSPQTLVSTGPNFLVFGHGKHACPGRFIVDAELKMLVGYLLTNYDLKFPAEYKGVRPECTWLSEACLPPSDAKILVKRREKI